jgi:maltoporin
MDSHVESRGIRSLKFTLLAGLTLLTTDALFAQSAGQSDLDALKARMDQMQKQYEQRIDKMDQERKQDKEQISKMEAEMKVLESKAASGSSILNTRVLTDAEGKGTEARGPLLDESFLKSLTRNFSFTVYARAGFQTNGSGGGGNFNFEVPDGSPGRFRLGNENDFYMELSWNQFHILGDSPDLADVSFRTTTVFTNSITKRLFNTTLNDQAKDFDIGVEEAFAEMKNVFKNAPEITFWGGQRFYDRYTVDPNDWHWLDTGGFGVGAYDIKVGPGNLWIAWLGSEQDNLGLFTNPNQINAVGNLFKQTIDIRYKDIDVGFGKLAFILLGNYVKGAEVTPNGGQVVTPTNGFSGVFNPSNPTAFNGTATIIDRTSDAYGIGGGAIWQYNFGNNSFVQLGVLAGWGATNFANDTQSDIQFSVPFSAATADVNTFLIKGRSAATNVHETAPGVFTVNDNPIQRQKTYLVMEEFQWNPTNCFSMDFWSYWLGTDNGFRTWGFNTQKDQVIPAPETSNLFGVGIRPVFWIYDNLAIQGQAGYNYVSNVRGYSDTAALGRSGSFGIFTIAPTIKPRGGYSTRPEIRLFATYAIWSNSLKGTTTPVGEGGNTSTNGSVPPYNHSNQGWLFGTQMEIWF